MQWLHIHWSMWDYEQTPHISDSAVNLETFGLKYEVLNDFQILKILNEYHWTIYQSYSHLICCVF